MPGSDSDRVRFGIGIPNVGEYADPAVLCELASEAEAADWDGVFLWDHIIYRDPGLPLVDPWIGLAGIATATSRVRIGVLMAGVARRRPWKLAREAVSLDHLSQGRLIFGAALGSMSEEYTAFGEDPDPHVRATKLDEGLDIIVGLWSGEPFSYRGRHFRIDQVTMQPPPLQQPRIPIWTGGRWPHRQPFRRAATWDGVMPTHAHYGHGQTMPPSELNACIEFTRSHHTNMRPLDFALEGETEGSGPTGWRTVTPYVDAGLTWWVEKFGWWRAPLIETLDRIRSGPPRP